MKLSKRLSLFFWLSSRVVLAQSGDPEIGIVNEEKYLYPILPGRPGSLAGNMGELRTTHFHSGIDIRTNNQSGYAVQASKSGYISRVSMTPGGYGNVIYITHPDGHTTLYAHLEKFSEPLASYVLNEQYRQKTFSIDLTFDETKFPVRQGDTIGISGNTGSSGGPHLHFDIRDANNHALDPLSFGFDEIKDVTPPQVEKVAFVTLDKNARINDKFGRYEFHAYRSGNTYSINAPILAYGNIGIEILAKDKFLPRDIFHGGVKYMEMRIDDKLHFIQSIDTIDVAETRGIYSLMNYSVLRNTGKRFYKLYIDDGNLLNFYTRSPGDGKIFVAEGKDRKVEITLKDCFGNSSKLVFRLRPSRPLSELRTTEVAPTEPVITISDNTLVMKCRPCKDSLLLFQSGVSHKLPPAYRSAAVQTYLVDLRERLPDSLSVCRYTRKPGIKSLIAPQVEYSYYSDWLDLSFPSNALFDTLYLGLSRDTINGSFTIGRSDIPLNRAIEVNVATGGRAGQVFRKSGRNSYSFVGGESDGDRIRFFTRELGEFVIMVDSVEPVIRPLAVNGYRLRFKISDELSGIAGYEATINGEWLLMHYDAKSGTIWSQPLDPSKPLDGEFVLRVTDNAGNKATYHTKI